MAAKRKSRRPARSSSSDAHSRLTETVHQIWLAGLGAVSKAQHGTPHLLEELISEGGRVDAQVRGAATETLRSVVGTMRSKFNAGVSSARGQASEAVDGLEKMFRSRVHRALTQLGVPSGQDIEALSRRVDALNANIGKLARTRTSPRRPTPAKRAPVSRRVR